MIYAKQDVVDTINPALPSYFQRYEKILNDIESIMQAHGRKATVSNAFEYALLKWFGLSIKPKFCQYKFDEESCRLFVMLELDYIKNEALKDLMSSKISHDKFNASEGSYFNHSSHIRDHYIYYEHYYIDLSVIEDNWPELKELLIAELNDEKKKNLEFWIDIQNGGSKPLIADKAKPIDKVNLKDKIRPLDESLLSKDSITKAFGFMPDDIVKIDPICNFGLDIYASSEEAAIKIRDQIKKILENKNNKVYSIEIRLSGLKVPDVQVEIKFVGFKDLNDYVLACTNQEQSEEILHPLPKTGLFALYSSATNSKVVVENVVGQPSPAEPEAIARTTHKPTAC